jgi:acyl carrier protein
MKAREDLKHVELQQRSATELQDLEAGSFDTVILNSVVQYFPDIEYLLKVLEEAIRLLSPGGKIFLGDVRHLGSLPTFHSAVQLSKAAATVSVGQLRRRVARAIAQDKELVIDPQLFELVPQRIPRISMAEVQLKRGRASNELTRYRYDVVLHTDNELTTNVTSDSLKWLEEVGSATELEAALSQRRWRAVRLHSIPNARLGREVAAQRLIDTSEDRLDASALRCQVSELQLEEMEPEIFWQLGEAHGYGVTVIPSESGCFEVRLVDLECADELPRSTPSPVDPTKSWSAYANDPLESGFRQQLIPQLRDHLKDRLPDYMVPSAWIALRQLPLTPNGKLDRRALPVPESRPEEMGEYIAPRTELERTLADIWAQLLRVDQVGVQDNFFELGGHSLLATRIITRISDVLDVDLPLRTLFETPTIQSLSDQIIREIADEVSTEAS